MIRRDHPTHNVSPFADPHRFLPGWSVSVGVLLLTTALGCILIASGCTPVSPVSATRSPVRSRPVATQPKIATHHIVLPSINSIRQEPTLRVRIAKSLARADIACGGDLLVGSAVPGQTPSNRHFRQAVAVTHYGGSFLVTDTQRRTIRWALTAMKLTPTGDTPILFNGKPYPGAIVLVPVRDPQGRPTGKIDIVNYVGMESYLPGVLERELYGSWDPATFRAAAIAARSYAVFEASMHAQQHYDLESTTASQAYAGHATNPKALAAVSQTRGLLIEYNGRVVPAFYSSACGGLGQDAKAAFTWLPGLPDITPLRGRNHGNWCQKSDKFRWGPIARAKASLALRIKTWGAQEDHPIRALKGIRDIKITHVNSVGRPAAFAISDMAGMTYTLGPEQFRFACNTAAPGLPKPAKGQSLNSSHVKVRLSASAVTFYDGHGYGHGVGLCQFGAQGLAQAGYNEHSILNYYYPESRLVRAYQ